MARVRAGGPLSDKELEALAEIHDQAPQELVGYVTEAEIEAVLKSSDATAFSGDAPAGPVEIHSSIWTRVMWAVMGGLAGGLFAIFALVDYRQHGFNYGTLICLPFVAFGIASAYLGSRPKSIKVDGGSLTFFPEVGKPRVFPKSSIGRMTTVSGRGGPSVRFLDKDGKKLFAGGMGFEISDLKLIASSLGVRLS